MCGIAGGWQVSIQIVEKMLARQNSRGPDNTGLEMVDTVNRVVFGHNRLSIIDKSNAGDQPMISPSGRWITYNGEVYNYKDLEIDGRHYSNRTDTERIIDEKNYNRLNGMFAFGTYDPDTGEIILVRDRFGIKPLYYTHQKDFFAFASTPAAVSLTKINWPVSTNGLYQYLSLGGTMSESMFDGIHAVAPGHCLTFNVHTQELNIRQWYYPRFEPNAIEKINDLVYQAIDRVKMTCDWPQVILLSGGIDSSLVASRYSGQKAIHLRSPEQEFAQLVANRFGLKLSVVDPEGVSAEDCLRDYVTKTGEPTMAGLIPYITCKEIAALGYRVAVTANGADELFFGYDRMQWLYHEQHAHIFRNFACAYGIPPLDDESFPTTSSRQWTELNTYVAHDLNKTLDFASMCHGVEVRVPYLDHQLVEAALSIPVNGHTQKLGNKTILKQMLRTLGFGDEFLHRPKVGFSLHYSPPDLEALKERAEKWYNQTDLPKLPPNPTPRQENYFKSSLSSLYIWYQIYKPCK